MFEVYSQLRYICWDPFLSFKNLFQTSGQIFFFFWYNINGIQAFANIMSCYKEAFPKSNLILVANPVPVYWGHISITDAYFKCYQLLLNLKRWKILIHVSATELPAQGINHIRYGNQTYCTKYRMHTKPS